MYIRNRYPVYELKTIKDDGNEVVRRTTRKKAFHYKLGGVQNSETIKQASFTIRYAPGAVNESISYVRGEFKEMARVARIFTAKDEIDFIMKGVSL